jgi:hypothetical protein
MASRLGKRRRDGAGDLARDSIDGCALWPLIAVLVCLTVLLLAFAAVVRELKS